MKIDPFSLAAASMLCLGILVGGSSAVAAGGPEGPTFVTDVPPATIPTVTAKDKVAASAAISASTSAPIARAAQDPASVKFLTDLSFKMESEGVWHDGSQKKGIARTYVRDVPIDIPTRQWKIVTYLPETKTYSTDTPTYGARQVRRIEVFIYLDGTIASVQPIDLGSVFDLNTSQVNPNVLEANIEEAD